MKYERYETVYSYALFLLVLKYQGELRLFSFKNFLLTRNVFVIIWEIELFILLVPFSILLESSFRAKAFHKLKGLTKWSWYIRVFTTFIYSVLYYEKYDLAEPNNCIVIRDVLPKYGKALTKRIVFILQVY